ncbi:flagellar biosynthetic protein FliO [Desulfuribacillus alkaliarsenatis]|uniref:Flagellar protein n=1 Tax=Desulfuribacillus alkaliarsenatis TaxID=766136 RepID=A0A1E5G685_9FIRM|nr:flagellar biosynthetic protein FliO [Desulfuribacillus alkaliarsenatis]OEF98619.1 hypothetical protein BHF68_02845 [Desulfuribacillus alkaliarsenatis]
MSNKVNTPVIILLLAIIIAVFIPASVNATGNVFDYFNQGTEQDENLADEVGTTTTNNTWLFISALIKLVVATTVIILIIYFGAKIITEKRRRFQSSQNMQTIGVHALGQNKTLQVVRIGKKIYLLGVGDNINLIKELSPEDSIKLYEQIEEQTQEASEDNNSFANQFDSVFKNKLSEFRKRNDVSPQYRNENEREYL